ncbi:MAG: hypothetical protein KDC79_12175 [Cyclobacteriaceae bacterium]|nr:hypothetical protein [Cyclobacteriaceae bacterium]
MTLTRILSNNATDQEKEKNKDYRNVVIAQIIIVVSGLVLTSFTNYEEPAFKDKLIITLFSGFAAFYAFLLWDLLKDFTTNRKLIGVVLVVLSVITIVGLLGEFPFYKVLEIENRREYLFALHASLFPIEVLVIGFAIRDLFSGNVFTSSKLWGAAAVYLMIGISFASLYDLINFVIPGSLGVHLTLGIESYSEFIYYSFAILGGLDNAYQNPEPVLRNIGVIEAVWGNLYAILIIGKLLGLPSKKEND